eukprot:737104-Prorocentrum_minimum.AAC.2
MATVQRLSNRVGPVRDPRQDRSRTGLRRKLTSLSIQLHANSLHRIARRWLVNFPGNAMLTIASGPTPSFDS